MDNSYLKNRHLDRSMDGSDLEGRLPTESGSVKRQLAMDRSRFYQELGKGLPEFPYRPTSCSEVTLTPHPEGLDFYFKSKDPSAEEGTKVLTIETEAEPIQLSHKDLAERAISYLRQRQDEGKLPDERYLMLRFLPGN